MSSKPKKKKTNQPAPAVVYTSEQGMRGGLNELIETQLSLKADQAAHDEWIASANTAHEKKMEARQARVAVLESSIALYCVNNRAELFPNDDPKSKAYENATIGYRLDPHSVSLVVEKDTEALVAMRLEAMADAREEEREAHLLHDMQADQLDATAPSLEWLREFIVWKPTLDKKRLLTRREQFTPAQMEILRQYGISFTQAEKFFIDPAADAADRLSKKVEVAKEVAA